MCVGDLPSLMLPGLGNMTTATIITFVKSRLTKKNASLLLIQPSESLFCSILWQDQQCGFQKGYNLAMIDTDSDPDQLVYIYCNL